MRHLAAMLLFGFIGCLAQGEPSAQQQPGPDGGATEAQIKSAEIELPLIIKAFELKPGFAVADVGAGFGAWTVALSKAVGPAGRVYASDVGAQQIAALKGAVERQKLGNVTVLEAGERATNLPVGCCDAILIRDAYHHFTQPADLTRSVAASLKPGGRLLVVDFPPRPNTEVPAGVPANRRGHGVPPEVIVEELTAAGLTHVRTDAQWSTASQPASLFSVLFQKPGR
jgi:predicted methyltransferase